jgi:hypothetical protein
MSLFSSFVTNYCGRRMNKILEDIVDNLNAWTERIVDVEERLKKSTDIRKSVVDSLNRQVLDGLISEQDSIELEYICDLWVNLYKSVLCKTVGADFSDRDVLTYLLELYTLDQISKKFFIDTALELCRND